MVYLDFKRLEMTRVGWGSVRLCWFACFRCGVGVGQFVNCSVLEKVICVCFRGFAWEHIDFSKVG